MKLHKNKNNFIDLIRLTSNYFGIETGLIEKDYFVTLILKIINEKIPGLVFKGGTSLSKCYKIIDRFSEDIDLTLDNEHFSQSKKRNANKTIIEVCDELEFNISNRLVVETHSHANYNVYNVEYPILFPLEIIKPELKIEMVFIQKSYPNHFCMVNSYIGEYLNLIGRKDIINLYNLAPFSINVQSLERTLVDKVFAVCDYYLSNEPDRNSRHIYDIYQILTKVNLNDELKLLIQKVRNDRKTNKTCLSAQDDVDIPKLLERIISTKFYEKDYNKTTNKLLIKPVSYDETIKSLSIIIESGLFINNI